MASRRSPGTGGNPSTGWIQLLLSVLPLGILTGLVGTGLVGTGLVGAGLLGAGSFERGSLAALEGAGAGGLGDLIFVVSGPNDGEPINGRVIPLRLQTNYSSPGILRVHVDGSYAFSKSLQATKPADGFAEGSPEAQERGTQDTAATGGDSPTAEQNIDLDLTAIERQRMSPVGGKDSTLRVTVYLYDATTLRLRAYDEWTGRLRRPRIDLLSTELAANGMQGLGGFVAPAGQVPVIVYPLPEDTYVFVFSSTQRSALDLSPENPAVYRQARIVLSGNTSRVVGGPTVNRSVVFASPGDSPLHLALWTYDAQSGWKRSPVLTLPAKR